MNHMTRKPTTLALAALLLVGSLQVRPACAGQTKPLPMEPLFLENPTSRADLATQTRFYEGVSVQDTLNAGAAALQDMGFKLTGSEQRFGVLVGEKSAEVAGAGFAHAVGEAALVTTTLILSLLVGQDVVTDLPEQVSQDIHVSLLVSEPASRPERGIEVRISLDRDMHYDNGQVIPDHTELPLVYQEFFDRLSRAIYFEGEQL